MATLDKPMYTVYVISGSKRYNLTSVLVSLDRSEAEGQIAQKVVLTLLNVKVETTTIASILNARDRVFVYANDGTNTKEVFRGYLWARKYRSSLSERELQFVCYDNLIYLQESEESLFFPSGRATQDIISTICESWGVKLNYSYENITHTKLPLRGRLYDIFTEDVLDPVKKKTGKKYVILSDKDTMYVKPVASNTTVYHFRAKKNVIATASGWTMDGVVTKVVIVGKADDEDREPIEATLTGNTSQYGTLQKIQSRSENITLEEAKEEAQTTIDEYGKPKWEYEIAAPDVPWIRKGDQVFVHAGDIEERTLIVVAVSRTSDGKKNRMTLSLEEK